MKKKTLSFGKKLFLLKDTITSLEQQDKIKGGATGISVCLTYCVSCGGSCPGPANTVLSVGHPCCRPPV